MEFEEHYNKLKFEYLQLNYECWNTDFLGLYFRGGFPTTWLLLSNFPGIIFPGYYVSGVYVSGIMFQRRLAQHTVFPSL